MEFETHLYRNISWPELEEKQKNFFRFVERNPTQGFLLISEPHSTFTHGRSSTPQELLWDSELLKQKGIAVEKVSRGGKWTYHGPGQMLIYPILNLRKLTLSRYSIKLFLETFREAICNGVTLLNLAPQKKENPFGIYLADKKLVSFGLAFPRGISTHGAAIYLTRQEASFEGIHPCGTPQQKSISLEEANAFSTWENAAALFSEEIKKSFKTLEKRLV